MGQSVSGKEAALEFIKCKCLTRFLNSVTHVFSFDRNPSTNLSLSPVEACPRDRTSEEL